MRTDETSERRPVARRVGDRLRAFRADAGGATMIEYTLIAAMLAVTVFASMGILTDAVRRVFGTATDAFGQVQ